MCQSQSQEGGRWFRAQGSCCGALSRPYKVLPTPESTFLKPRIPIHLPSAWTEDQETAGEGAGSSQDMVEKSFYSISVRPHLAQEELSGAWPLIPPCLPPYSAFSLSWPSCSSSRARVRSRSFTSWTPQ